MVYNSLKKLTDKFPFFLDRSPDSNFVKTQKVFNNRLKDMYNEVFNVYLAGKLLKHVFVWKVQVDPYVYEMFFHASFDDIKTVRISKNYIVESTQEVEMDDGTTQEMTYTEEITEEIYTETFTYEDHINKFEYLHEDTSKTIIPKEKYLFEIETWDEHTINKGFPENDKLQENEYDHDYSLDGIGALYNVPRKKYKPVEELHYPTTEPSYNDRLTEDDYHYMNRIIYYIENLLSTPLPVLEIWKLFGIPLQDISMINRDRYIARMIDVDRHSTEDGYNWNWSPQKWEHKDRWCTHSEKDLFFFAEASNNTPIALQSFNFKFNIIDSLCRTVNNDAGKYYDVFNPRESMNLIGDSDEPFYILPFVNGLLVDVPLTSDEIWVLTPLANEDTDELVYQNENGDYYLNNKESDDFRFIFKCFRTLGELEAEKQRASGKYLVFDDDWISDEILISVRGCNSASWYVNSVTGDDANSGMSKTDAFKTLDKALDMVEGEFNIVSLAEGKYDIQNTRVIDVHTVILSCPGTDVMIYHDNNRFFSISPDASLYLQNIGLKCKCCRGFFDNYHYINKNMNKNPFYVGVNTDNYSFHDGKPVKVNPPNCLIPTSITMILPEKLYYAESFNINGVLSMADDTGVSAETITLLIDDEIVDETTTNGEGEYTFNGISFEDTYEHTVTVRHEYTSEYDESESTRIIRIESSPVKLNVDNLTESVLVKTVTQDNKRYVNIIQDYTLLDGDDEPVTVGVLELYEDNVLVESITPSETFTYAPNSVGLKEYRVLYNPVDGYEPAEYVFNCNVIYNTVNITLLNNNIFLEEDDVCINGLLSSLTGDSVTGEVVLTGYGFDDDSFEVSDSSFMFEFDDLDVGKYNIHLEYNDTDTVKVFADASIDFEFYVTNPASIVYEDSEGRADVMIDIPPEYYQYFEDKEYIITDVEVFEDDDNRLVIADEGDDISEYTGDDDIVLVNTDSDVLDLIVNNGQGGVLVMR